MKVSVIISTIGRCGRLCDTVNDLKKQDYPDFEIIVVDQTKSYTDQEEESLKAVRSAVRYIRLPRPGVVAACNRGVKEASGGIVILVDDDVRISDAGFIRKHCLNYDDPAIAAVAGQILHDGQERANVSDPRHATDPLPWMFIRLDSGTRCDIESCGAGNFSFRRSVWKGLGGFDERFIGNAYRWESDFCFRLRKAGHRLVFDPAAALTHLYGQSDGGCENQRLFHKSAEAFPYLCVFFRNNMYFYLKNCPLSLFPLFLMRLAREHVVSRAYLQAGGAVFLSRMAAFVWGFLNGCTVAAGGPRP